MYTMNSRQDKKNDSRGIRQTYKPKLYTMVINQSINAVVQVVRL